MVFKKKFYTFYRINIYNLFSLFFKKLIILQFVKYYFTAFVINYKDIYLYK